MANVPFSNQYSWIRENTIRLGNLTQPRLVPEVIVSLNRLINKFEHKKVIIDFEEVTSVYPFPLIPIVGYIEYFKTVMNVEFEYVNVEGYLKHINISEPLKANIIDKNFTGSSLDRIWSFRNSTDISTLTTAIIKDLRRSHLCQDGVLDAIKWGINEVMDNVIQHSQTDVGFVMAQAQKGMKTINVCIFDYGRGIYKSLKGSEYNPRSAIDAISMAVKEGVTRDRSVGLGNGLWGLFNMVSLNDGSLIIISGNGGIDFHNQGQESTTLKDIVLLNKYNQATTLNFRLNLEKPISIVQALNGQDVTDLYIDNLYDDYNRIVYPINSIASGTGTRESAKEIQNEVMNIFFRERKKITLDFAEVGIITSSFADELICKLIDQYGFIQFQMMFEITNMNKEVRGIVEKALKQRLGTGS
jgi:anti-sigma regulatory factor (Ser/Thr protein kinase)